jgi:hypothetical protein
VEKIPTLFKRDPQDMRQVLPEVTPGCEWVLAGEGVATRKYDGTCVMLDGERWWARREVKPDRAHPPSFVQVAYDALTGKVVGWEPIEQSPFAKFHAQALDERAPEEGFPPGTYELVGPKINGNPEGYEAHTLIAHDGLPQFYSDAPYFLTFDRLREAMLSPSWEAEGLVWHHPDGRMAKLKRRDFAAGHPQH